MPLPPRKWYTLQQAAEKLTRDLKEPVTVEDLLHFAAIGKLELCIKMRLDDEQGMQIDNVKDERLAKLRLKFLDYKYRTMKGRLLYSKSLTLKISEEKSSYLDADFEFMEGFLAIYFLNTDDYFLDQKIANNRLILNDIYFKTPRDEILEGLLFEQDINDNIVFHCAIQLEKDYEIPIPKEAFYILEDEYNILINGGRDIEEIETTKQENPRPISTKSENQRNQFIRDLLTIYYGTGVDEKIRSLLDNKDSEIRRDFETKGLTPPSGKTVDKWLNRN